MQNSSMILGLEMILKRDPNVNIMMQIFASNVYLWVGKL